MKQSFVIYYSYREILEDLSDEEFGKVFRALFDYEIDGKLPNFQGLMKMGFTVMKGNLDRDKNSYDKRCETSAENGKKGGRPKKGNENLKKPNLKPNKPKKADNDNENDNETDTENDNENDNETDTDNGKSADLSESEESETNADLFTFIQEALGRTINNIEYEVINGWQDNDLTRYAVKESILNGARGIRYIQTVLESWNSKGFKTVQDVQAYQEKRKKALQSKNQEREKPDWFNKDLKNELMTEEDKKELDEILNSIEEKIGGE